MYSSAFRRLAGVTQVAAPTELYPIHNRLTHSLKVGLIGRGLAVRLQNDNKRAQLDRVGGVDPAVVEAAGLAHDLGHPPFGHVAEHELNALVSHGLQVRFREEEDSLEIGKFVPGSSDGFEGNAQSFRIVTKLAARYPGHPRLNLTQATLCALLKYPWHRIGDDEPPGGRNPKKWGAYRSEQAEFGFARSLAPEGSTKRSLEAKLMDWADDIAYAVHDLEDFYRAGLIPLDRLTTSKIELTDFLKAEKSRQTKAGEDPPDLAELSSALLRPLTLDKAYFKGPYTGTQRERAMLREFTSKLIGRYMDAIKLESDKWGEDSLVINRRRRLEVETLKGLTWYYVIESQSLASQRFGQRNVIRTLFEMYANAAFSGRIGDRRIFPVFFQEMLKDADSDDDKLRVVSDTIASMSESQAFEIYQRLTGLSIESALMRPPL